MSMTGYIHPLASKISSMERLLHILDAHVLSPPILLILDVYKARARMPAAIPCTSSWELKNSARRRYLECILDDDRDGDQGRATLRCCHLDIACLLRMLIGVSLPACGCCWRLSVKWSKRLVDEGMLCCWHLLTR